jgi:hypothetical protein
MWVINFSLKYSKYFAIKIVMQKMNVIWLASFPKSGNTWMNSLIRQTSLNKGVIQELIQGHASLRKGQKPKIFHLVKPNCAAQPCSVLKTHYLYEEVLADNSCLSDMELSTAGYVHIYRNPLEVLLSYLNYTRLAYQNLVRQKPPESRIFNFKKVLFIDTLGFSEPYGVNEWEKMNLDKIPQKNLDYALDCFSDANLSIPGLHKMSGSWIEHISSWKKAKEEVNGLSLRYEDCLENPNEFFRLREFFDFSEKEISEALSIVNSEARERLSDGHLFYNKMQAYYFPNYFSPSAIARFFKKHENTLKNFGYGFLLSKNNGIAK